MATTTPRETLPEVAADLCHTLLICQQGLPEDTHPINLERIRIIKMIIVWATRSEGNAAYWAEQLRRAEHAVDVRSGKGDKR